MQAYTKLALIATVLFLVVGMQSAYNTTQGVFGSIVGQTGADYGSGNNFKNRGFLLHAVVFYLAMYMILKKQR